jgi:hypothetical protein
LKDVPTEVEPTNLTYQPPAKGVGEVTDQAIDLPF